MRGHKHKIFKQHAKRFTRIYSFSNRIVRDRNELTPDIVDINKYIQTQTGCILEGNETILVYRVGSYRRQDFLQPKYIILSNLI